MYVQSHTEVAGGSYGGLSRKKSHSAHVRCRTLLTALPMAVAGGRIPGTRAASLSLPGCLLLPPAARDQLVLRPRGGETVTVGGRLSNRSAAERREGQVSGR